MDSVLRCLKGYVRSTIKNVRLSSLGLVDIHRHFEGRFWTTLRNSVIKIVLDSMLYETLKWPPDRTILHLVKTKSQTAPPLKNYGVHTIKPQLRP